MEELKDVSGESSSLKRLLIPFLFAALVLIGSIVYLQWYGVKGVAQDPFIESIMYAERGDFRSANQALSLIVQNTNDPQVKARAETQIAANTFREFEFDSQREAIRQLKEVLKTPELSAYRRVSALNRLIGLYYFGRDPKIAEEIFIDEPYRSFMLDANGDTKLAIRKLIEFSDATYPTTFAKLRLAFWYSGELLDNTSLSLQTKEEYGTQIATLIKEADELYPREVELGTLNTEALRALFWHFRSLNVATLYAAGLTEDPADFEKSFANTFSFNQPERGEANKAVQDILVYTHLYYGGFLSEIFGSARAQDIQLEGDAVVNIASAVADPNKDPFNVFLRVERDKPLADRDHNNRFFSGVAQHSPRFADFLVLNGWNL